jgi:hypothetical protein
MRVDGVNIAKDKPSECVGSKNDDAPCRVILNRALGSTVITSL